MKQPCSTTTRRHFLTGAAGAMAAWQLASTAAEGDALQSGKPRRKSWPKPKAAAAKRPAKARFPVVAISSHNGQTATRKAYGQILQGTDVLDACVAGVSILEDDPDDYTVGLGGLPNEEGEVELDAAVMHGPTHQGGAVAALKNIKNPARLAALVMRQTDHVLLVGAGALKFARAQGFKEQDLLTEKARKIWLHWKQTLSDKDDWLPPSDRELDPDVARFFGRPTGTIHVSAMNAAGDVSCVTTTSGLAFKLAGRVGDSPIIGAGLYADNDVGCCGSTGRGEANLQNLCSFAAVELMRNGASPKEAGLEVLRRVAKKTAPRLRDAAGRPKFNLKFYVLAKSGSYAGVAMWGPSEFAVTDKKGTRLEKCATLYERKRQGK